MAAKSSIKRSSDNFTISSGSCYIFVMEIYTIEFKDQLRMLRQVASPIEDINGQTVKLAEDMIATMIEAKGIGLAGPQVGMKERIFIVQIDENDPLVFINPEIISTSPELANYEEGCLSIPGQYAEIKRPKTIQVQAWNHRGRAFNLEATGLLATVIQHELDHLNGILFIDHISSQKRSKILGKFNLANTRVSTD